MFILWIICVTSVLCFHANASVHCCLVVTCWEWTDLVALVCDVKCVFSTFPCVILGQVWYLIISIPDLCRLSYFCILPGREDKAIILTFKAPVTTNAVLKPRKNSVDKDKTALVLVHAVRFFSNIWQLFATDDK